MFEDRSADEWMIDHRKIASEALGLPLLLTLLMGTVVLLAACGQVVTPEPTRASLSADTPTAVSDATHLTTPLHRPATEVPSGSQPDTATPTITPTPIVHVVQQGDTLQAIAFDFGVSVEALQKANGVENPQFLQVGQRLVIPRQEEPGQTTPGQLLPTPTPQPIQIQGMGFYETPVDSLLALGEVANTTAVTLTNVQVQVALLNAASEPVMEANTFVAMDIIPAGELSPFRVLFTTPPPDWVSYQATVIRGQEAGAVASAYVPLSVVAAEGNPSGPHFQVNGTVKNTSTQRAADSVDVFITTYDAEGTVTGFRKTKAGPSAPGSSSGSGLVEEGLAPGAEVTFSCSLATHGDVPYDFTITVLGHAAEGITSGG